MSADGPVTRIISHDWTNLFRHRSRQFTMDEFRVAHGVDWIGAAAAGASALVLSGSLAALLWLVGITWWWVGLLVGIAVGGATYPVVAKDTEGSITPIESLILWLDFHLFQPAMLQDTGKDEYPTELHWQVILFRPDDMPEYSDRYPSPAPYGTYRK